MKIETHFHTAQVSPCGRVMAEEGIRLYHESGFHAVVVTDHFSSGVMGKEGAWEEKVERLLSGYRTALQTGKELGVRVYLGMEIRFEESENDYLVYGITPEFLYDHPWIYLESKETFSKISRENGFCMIQAHPMRGSCTPVDPALLDGYEGYNGNPRHNSRNAQARSVAEECGLVWTSGSDFHHVEDLAAGGIEMDILPADERELADKIKQGQFKNFIPAD